jgi:hypothetical protein
MARYAAAKSLAHLDPPRRLPSCAIDTRKKHKAPAFALVEELTAGHCQMAYPECDVRGKTTNHEPLRWGWRHCCSCMSGHDGGGAGGE